MADADPTEEKQSEEVLERLRQLNVLCRAGVRLLLRRPATAGPQEARKTILFRSFLCIRVRVSHSAALRFLRIFLRRFPYNYPRFRE